MRILGDELVFFFGDEWHWNWMDLLLVTLSAVEMIAELIVTSMNITSMRLLRLLRIFRVLRSIRVLSDLHLLGKIRMLLLAIQHSVGPLIWACVLILGPLYMASLFFLNGVSEYLMSGASDPEAVGVLHAVLLWLSGVDVAHPLHVHFWRRQLGSARERPDDGSRCLWMSLRGVYCMHAACCAEHHRGHLRERRH